MPNVFGHHVDGYTCIIIIITAVYSVLLYKWLKTDDRHTTNTNFTAPSLLSTRPSFRSTSSAGAQFNFSQWVEDPSIDQEPCCNFLQSLATPLNPLRYRFGVDYQSCCSEATYNGSRVRPLRFVGGSPFDGKRFLKAMRAKRVVFVGDSLMRQTVTAMVCAIERTGTPPKRAVKPEKQPWDTTLPDDDQLDFSAEYDDDTRVERVRACGAAGLGTRGALHCVAALSPPAVPGLVPHSGREGGARVRPWSPPPPPHTPTGLTRGCGTAARLATAGGGGGGGCPTWVGQSLHCHAMRW